MQDAREKIFEERRDYMRCPTTDEMNKGTMLHKDAFAKVHNFDKFEDLPDKIKNKFRQPCFRALCAYPECGKALEGLTAMPLHSLRNNFLGLRFIGCRFLM